MISSSLSKRLRGVVLLIALGLIVSAAMTWRMGTIASRALAAAQQTTLSTVVLSQAQSTLWALRWGAASFLAAKEPQDKAKFVADSPVLRAQFHKLIQQYAETHPPEASQAKLRELQAAFDKYANLRIAFFGLMDAGKVDEAVQLRNGQLTPAGGATTKAFSELIELQRHQLAEDFQTDSRSVASARTFLLFVFASTLAASVAGLAWLARSTLRQLGGEPALVSSHVALVAQGDLSTSIDTRGAAPASLMLALSDMQKRLATLVGQIRHSAESIAERSVEITAGNANLSRRTEQQASNLQETSASMEQLSATVKNNAELARQASQLARSASVVAKKGGSVVGEVVLTMNDIATSSRRIVDIIDLIDSISFQTNILALNAAVEAARAGQQGRGFAVVASEVRALAGRSAEAAKAIKSLIDASVEKVEVGSKLVGDAGANMTDIVDQVQRVSDLIAEISAATTEQTTGIGQVSAAVTQLDHVTQQNADLVEHSATAAETLEAQAQKLLGAVAEFKL